MNEQLQQTLQHIVIQKQTMKRQQIEVESAIEELNTKAAWKVVGNIMVKKKPEELKAELKEKLETITQRLKQLETQEERLQEKLREHASN